MGARVCVSTHWHQARASCRKTNQRNPGSTHVHPSHHASVPREKLEAALNHGREKLEAPLIQNHRRKKKNHQKQPGPPPQPPPMTKHIYI